MAGEAARENLHPGVGVGLTRLGRRPCDTSVSSAWRRTWRPKQDPRNGGPRVARTPICPRRRRSPTSGRRHGATGRTPAGAKADRVKPRRGKPRRGKRHRGNPRPRESRPREASPREGRPRSLQPAADPDRATTSARALSLSGGPERDRGDGQAAGDPAAIVALLPARRRFIEWIAQVVADGDPDQSAGSPRSRANAAPSVEEEPALADPRARTSGAGRLAASLTG